MDNKFELAISIQGDNSIIAPIVVSVVCSNTNNLVSKKLSNENFDVVFEQLKKDFYFIETRIIFPYDIYCSIEETIKYSIKECLKKHKKLTMQNTTILDDGNKDYINKVANFISNNLRKKILESENYFYPFLDLTKNKGNYTISLINKLKKINYNKDLFIISEEEFNKIKDKSTK